MIPALALFPSPQRMRTVSVLVPEEGRIRFPDPPATKPSTLPDTILLIPQRIKPFSADIVLFAPPTITLLVASAVLFFPPQIKLEPVLKLLVPTVIVPEASKVGTLVPVAAMKVVFTVYFPSPVAEKKFRERRYSTLSGIQSIP